MKYSRSRVCSAALIICARARNPSTPTESRRNAELPPWSRDAPSNCRPSRVFSGCASAIDATLGKSAPGGEVAQPRTSAATRLNATSAASRTARRFTAVLGFRRRQWLEFNKQPRCWHPVPVAWCFRWVSGGLRAQRRAHQHCPMFIDQPPALRLRIPAYVLSSFGAHQDTMTICLGQEGMSRSLASGLILLRLSLPLPATPRDSPMRANSPLTWVQFPHCASRASAIAIPRAPA